MSKLPSQIKKGVTGAAHQVAGAAKQVAKVAAAPVRGGILGAEQAQSRGKTGPAAAKKVVQGVAAGFAHPNKVTAAHKMGGGGGAQAPIQVIKKAPGAGGVVNFKGKKPT